MSREIIKFYISFVFIYLNNEPTSWHYTCLIQNHEAEPKEYKDPKPQEPSDNVVGIRGTEHGAQP